MNIIPNTICGSDKKNNYKFNIIISTYNRPMALSRAIQSILAQTHQDFKIIVSDDASYENIEDAVRGLNDKRISYISNTKKSGLSATRNAAMRLCEGEYLIFMDDDITLKNNFLEVLEQITNNNKAGVFCPRILDPDTDEPFTKLLNTKSKYLGRLDFNYFLGGNHILNNRIAKKAGFYDERFGVSSRYHAAEESDYFFRLKRSGERVLYCPELIAYHPREQDMPGWKAFNYSYGISAMLAKQISLDPLHSYLYILIILRRLIISLLRSLQYTFFPKSIQAKNKIYKYSYFFKGTLKGIFDYLRLG